MQSTESIRAAKIGYFVISSAFCILGILLMLFPGIPAMALCYVLGTILIVYGAVKIVGYFSKDLYRLAFQYDLAFGVLLAVVGLLMVFDALRVISFLSIVLGVLILADGLFKIQMSLDAKVFGIRKWWVILAFAVLAGTLGLLLILYPIRSAGFIMILFGMALLAEGVLGIFVTLYAVEAIRRYRPDRGAWKE